MNLLVSNSLKFKVFSDRNRNKTRRILRFLSLLDRCKRFLLRDILFHSTRRSGCVLGLKACALICPKFFFVEKNFHFVIPASVVVSVLCVLNQTRFLIEHIIMKKGKSNSKKGSNDKKSNTSNSSSTNNNATTASATTATTTTTTASHDSGGGGVEMSSTSTCPICNKAADKLCSACRTVSYCSAEHQKQHWKKEHKHNCRVWAVKTNDIMGRYVVAARDLPAGTIIMDEEALAYGPKQDTLPICLGCHKRVDGKYFCSKCWFPMCSKECEEVRKNGNNEYARGVFGIIYEFLKYFSNPFMPTMNARFSVKRERFQRKSTMTIIIRFMNVSPQFGAFVFKS